MQVSKSLFVLCIFGLLALPLVGVASAQNLLPNGTFETGDLTGWLIFGQSANSDVTIVSGQQNDFSSLPGQYSAFLDNQAEALGLTLKGSTPAASASMGTVYYSVDLRLDSADVGGVLFVNIFAEQAGGGVLGGSGLIGPVWAWNEWSVISGTFEAPLNTDFLTIQIEANTGAATGSNCQALADNVYLGQAGPPVATEEMSMGSIKALYR